MMSKNELTSGEKDTVRRSKKTEGHRHRQWQGIVDGGSDRKRSRYGGLSHNDAVGRFTSSAVSGLVDAKNWATSVNGKRESLYC